MKRLLIVYASQTGRTRSLIAAAHSAIQNDFAEDVELRLCPALQAGIDDLLWAQALLLGTPENFGYMAGALKDFLDRTYYPAEGRTLALPYALIVSAGNDGSGAVRAVERIATGYGWNRVAEALIVKGEPDDAALARAAECGQTLAAGLSCGIF